MIDRVSKAGAGCIRALTCAMLGAALVTTACASPTTSRTPPERHRQSTTGPTATQADSLQTTSDCAGVVQRTVDLVNERRRTRELPLLTCDPKVGRAAAIHAEDLCTHNRLSHTGSDGSTMVDRARRVGIEFRTLGENVAKGQRSADEVVDEWMASPPHRKNILNEAFRRIGIARATCPQSAPIWVQVFAG